MSTLRPSPVYLCCPDLNSELAVHHVRKAIHKSPYGAVHTLRATANMPHSATGPQPKHRKLRRPKSEAGHGGNGHQGHLGFADVVADDRWHWHEHGSVGTVSAPIQSHLHPSASLPYPQQNMDAARVCVSEGEFSRYGGWSGGYPDKLWPSHSRLQELAAEERERHPPMEVMLDNIAAREREREREREEEQRRMDREKIIAANMAKMSKMIADWKKLKKEAKQKQREEEIKRDKLLAEVREQFGYALDPSSAKFKEMFGEIEKEKKKRKLLKSRKREEEQGTVAAESRQQILLYSATVTYCKIGYFVSLESEKLIFN
ncbi:uncharacterized protein LOC113067531 [Carassius auratus]|uniref:Large ribosomal subunit protein mL64 n=1 Tax=Carassius auratus TaxID=7957 RepID=A0A6P6MH19_CARAU|nr:uncharacterized protein LOC113067531 [Carassius auratus]